MAQFNEIYLDKEIPAGISMYASHISGDNGCVSSENPYATQAGLEILKAGGNAFDAAAAVALMLGLVEPQHSGLGGGCFQVGYCKKSNSCFSVDARGIAPIHAYETMFLDHTGEVDPNLTEFSGRSATTPAFYRALDELLKNHGTMTLAQVSAPAIKVAREGFCCGFVYARVSNHPQAEHNENHYAGFSDLYLNNGKPRVYGELITNPDLADTMEQVALHGVDWFYNGPIADEIVAHVNRHHGLFVKEDMTRCQTTQRDVVRGNYRGYDVVSMAPPSSGGTHLIQMLNILAHFDLKGMGHSSADYIHVLAETMKIMFADRSVAMGDPNFVNIQSEILLSKDYAKQLASKINMDQGQDFAPREGIDAKSYDGCTSNFEIMDAQGNVLVQTQTIRNWWGSGVVIPGRGFLMNNTMSDFSAKVGTVTSMGLSYGEANAVRPGATPLSSMSPSIVFQGDTPILAVGAAGGPRIITATLQLILNVLDHGMMMDRAVRAPLMCCLTQGQGLELEYGISPDTKKLLAARGHRIVDLPVSANMFVLPNGIYRIGDTFYPGGTTRSNGGGGVLIDREHICIDGFCCCKRG